MRNAATGPNAARRYTYSPPACGRSAASSAYAHRAGERDESAGEPHANHRDGIASQRRDDGGRQENPAADDVGNDDGGGVNRAESSVERRTRHRLVRRQELALDWKLAQFYWGGRTRLAENLDLEIDEQPV